MVYKKKSKRSSKSRRKGRKTVHTHVSFKKVGNELKYRDEYRSGSQIVAGWGGNTEILTSLLTVPQGLTSQSRVGKDIFITSLHFKFYLEMNQAQTDAIALVNSIRVLLVVDKQCNGSLPTLDTVLDKTDSGGSEVNPSMAYRKLKNSGRFTILKDSLKKLDMDFVVGTGGESPTFAGKMEQTVVCNINFKKALKITYSANTGGLAERTENNVFLYLISKNSFDPQACAYKEMCARIRYYD